MNQPELTLLEVHLLKKITTDETCDGDATRPAWLSSVIDNSELSPQSAGGVLTSLQSKGLAVVKDMGGKIFDMAGNAIGKDATVVLTEDGLSVFNSLR